MMRESFVLAASAVVLAASATAAAREERVQYPPGAGHFSVRDFGAKGDGRTDDTEAFARALAAVKMHFQIIYVPDGEYLVSDTISWGAWITLQGESRSGTVIRLKDSCPGFSGDGKPVIRCMFNNNMSFSNYIRHLTVDTGRGNPGAVGVRFNAHNHGVLEHVTIRSGDGSGRIGLDMSETEFGPGMARRFSVEGFDVGIRTPGLPSNATLERVALKGQRVVGVENHFPVSILGLRSENRVPAVRNSGHSLSQLVLVDAELSGGAPDACAIESDGCHYLRNVKASGYRAALKERGSVVAGGVIAERVSGDVKSVLPSPARHLGLAIEEPPEAPDEPVARWVVPDASAEDDTAALQRAIDSGASTICLPSNVQYFISDTIRVRGKVSRIVGLKHHHGNLRARDPAVFRTRPMLRVEGEGTEPVTIESMGVSSWPEVKNEVIELATSRPVYLKYVWTGSIVQTPESTGDLFIDEGGADLRLNPGQRVWVRQYNPENNPFDPANPRLPRTYVVNKGADLWVLGMKTEAPAVHVVTLDGGRSEILGGFFRDHFGPNEYGWRGEPPVPGVGMDGGVPYFITIDASSSASYVQYAWAHGKARELQAVEARGGVRKELRTPPGTFAVGLYSGAPADAARREPARKRTAAAPDAPAARSAQASEDAPPDDEILRRLREALASGRRVSFHAGSVGRRVRVLAVADDGTLEVAGSGLVMKLAWDRLTADDRRNMAAAVGLR